MPSQWFVRNMSDENHLILAVKCQILFSNSNVSQFEFCAVKGGAWAEWILVQQIFDIFSTDEGFHEKKAVWKKFRPITQSRTLSLLLGILNFVQFKPKVESMRKIDNFQRASNWFGSLEPEHYFQNIKIIDWSSDAPHFNWSCQNQYYFVNWLNFQD